MKDVTIKTTTSDNRLKRYLSFSEELSTVDAQTKIEKKWMYSVKDKEKLENVNSVKAWIENHRDKKRESNLKFISIAKEHNSKSHEDIFNSTAVGDLFVVTSGYVFCVEFLYSLRIYVHGGRQI